MFRLASDSDAKPEDLLIQYWRDKKIYSYGLKSADISYFTAYSNQKNTFEKL